MIKVTLRVSCTLCKKPETRQGKREYPVILMRRVPGDIVGKVTRLFWIFRGTWPGKSKQLPVSGQVWQSMKLHAKPHELCFRLSSATHALRRPLPDD